MRYLTVLAWMWLLIGLVGCDSLKHRQVKQEPDKVTQAEIRNLDGNYQLYVNGEPFWIKGAGLEFGDVASLAEHGGNSFRTWTTNNGSKTALEVLDEAWEHGLYVTMGINVARERHGFDYNDEAAVKAQFERIKKDVNAIKDHPALLIWGIGNELNLHATNHKVWDAVNDISRYIHQVDPHHLTTTSLAGINAELVREIQVRAPDVDLLSVQMYGNLPNLPAYICETGWKGPYMVTEWGTTGHWEVGVTEWGAPIENHSTLKAKLFRERYQQAIESEKDGQCIGAYVFLWGQKQERTPTWYGLFLQSGEETESVESMHYLWNNSWPDNRCPQVEEGIRLDGKLASSHVYLAPGETYTAQIAVTDPDGDSLAFHWEVKPESTDLGEGGDRESVPPTLHKLIGEVRQDGTVTLQTPEKEGAYRLFVYIRDGQNHAAHANIPFYVK